MTAERKLKSEIDRTLKKVQEGQDAFEDLWQQVHECDNANQREKLEDQLKKEIKKLQRLREQIKGWITNADIKDKQPLLDARKSIERDMERFKVCEREMKAVGRQGTLKPADPREKAKDDVRDWINNAVESLQGKIDAMEYELEELQGQVKKKQKPPPRVAELEEITLRHKEHINRLEKVLRCIDNDTIQPDENGVDQLKSDMDMYLNDECEDNGIDVTHIDGMYEELSDRLEAVDLAAPAAVAAHAHAKLGKGKDKEELEREREQEKQRAAVAAARAQLVAQGNHNIKLADDDEPTGHVGKVGPATPVAGAAKVAAGGQGRGTAALETAASLGPPGGGGASPNGGPGTQPPATPRGAAHQEPVPALAMGTPGVVVGRPGAPGFPPPGGAPGAGQRGAAAGPPPGILTPVAGTPPAGVAPPPASAWGDAAAAQAPGKNLIAKLAAGGQAAAAANATTPPAAQAAGAAATATRPPPGYMATPLGKAGSLPDSTGLPAAAEAGGADTAAAGGPRPGPWADAAASAAKTLSLDGPASAALRAAMVAASPTAAAQAAQQQQQQQAQQQPAGPLASPVTPGGLNPRNLPPLEPPSYPAVQPAYSNLAAKQILEACYARAHPQPADTDMRAYRPRHPALVPPSYPRIPHEVTDNPSLFRKVDPEVLFFAFYFQPGSHQQYMAAHELKRQSWRFHKHHNAWFQRFTEPSVTNEEYEQGAYVYFDYNIVHDDLQTGWCYRRKEAFTFRYDALEDELRPAPPTPPVSGPTQSGAAGAAGSG